MSNDPASSPEDRLRDLPLRSEEIGFSPDAMVPCGKCARPNAPNRAACIYCGHELEGAAKGLNIRPLEDWERGFNLIVSRSDADVPDRVAKELASILAVDPETLATILRSGKHLPIARVATEEQAGGVSELLARNGIESRTISDDSLLLNWPPVRLRTVEFEGDELLMSHFNGDRLERIRNDDLALIVTATFFADRIESVEKRKRGATKTLSTTQISSDEPVIDIYTRSDGTGWRIPASGFDFSCLLAGKSLIAAANMERLISHLRRLSPSAKVADEYVEIRSMLELCWQSQSRKDALGFQRSGFARKDLASVMTTNNAVQLTKYSRLQWHLL